MSEVRPDIGRALARICADRELQARMKDDPRGVLEELGVREELERRVAEDPAGFLSELYGGALPDSALQMVTGGAELATLSVNTFYSFLQQDAILRFDSPFAPPYVPVGPVV